MSYNMKRVLLLFLSLLFFTASQGQALKAFARNYTPLPSRPTFSSPATITDANKYATGLFWYNSWGGSVGVGKDVILQGPYVDGFDVNFSAGTPSQHIRFSNFDSTVVLGNSTVLTQHGAQGIGISNYLDFYGKSPSEPLIVESFTNNGFQFLPQPIAAGGGVFIVQNAVAKYPGSSGFTANGSAGNASGTDTAYVYLEESFFRSFKAGQEGICYIGTTHAPFAVTLYAYIHDNFSYNSSREGTQFEHINLLKAIHNTCYLPASNWNGSGGGGQDNCVQAHDLGPGSSITYSVYDQGPRPWNIFTHGTRFAHNYISYTTSYGYIGDCSTTYFAGSPRLTGDSIIFEYDYIVKTGATAPFLTQIAEPTAPIIFRNCTFVNITAIYQDIRGAHTNTITGNIGDHGNVSVSASSVPAPTYKSLLTYDYQNHGLITTDWFIDRRMGYRMQ